MTSGAIENDTYQTRRPQKPRYRYRHRISSPSRSHFSPRLKLMLQTQVTNPEVATFQSFSKGVYDTTSTAVIATRQSYLIHENQHQKGHFHLSWIL